MNSIIQPNQILLYIFIMLSALPFFYHFLTTRSEKQFFYHATNWDKLEYKSMWRGFHVFQISKFYQSNIELQKLSL